ncbi:MAG: lycopene cyclase family protein [Raineya sp.]
MYDYIIAGSGAAGLSLAFYMAKSELRHKKVLLIDKNPKQQNDRTWCFWQKETSPYEEILHQTWENIFFRSKNFTATIPIQPYRYKMMRGEDFYHFTQNYIQKNTAYEFLQAEILNFDVEKNAVETSKGYFQADLIFDSTWKMDFVPEQKKGYHYFYQHFKGWFIETPSPTFDANTMYYMDFAVPQKDSEVRFGYVLPFSASRALVEYTIFSDNLLAEETYIAELKNYLENILNIKEYRIYEEEFGVIPMFDTPFSKPISPKIIPIGTKAGAAKSSTGFAFDRIQRESKKIVGDLLLGKIPQMRKYGGRYALYDSALLNVIANNRFPSEEIFARMFAKHPHSRIFRFLDEESSFWKDDLPIMAKMPWLPFVNAILQNLMR